MSFNNHKINYTYGNFTQTHNDNIFNPDLWINSNNNNLNYIINKNLKFTNITLSKNAIVDDDDLVEENE